MRKIRIAIVGVGNCASSLVQGINFYEGSSRNGAAVGLMHRQIGGYRPSDVEVVAAFDIDRRKVGLDVSRAIFSPPNCTKVFCEQIKLTGAIVKMGCVLDGYPPHMHDQDPLRTFLPLEKETTREDIIAELKNSSAELMVNYLPVGSEQATRFYAGCALEAGLGFVNNIPVFIASDPAWAKRFADKNLPLIGDDIKAQVGATIVHRAMVDLFRKRGVCAAIRPRQAMAFAQRCDREQSPALRPIDRLVLGLIGMGVIFASLGLGEAVYRFAFLDFDRSD